MEMYLCPASECRKWMQTNLTRSGKRETPTIAVCWAGTPLKSRNTQFIVTLVNTPGKWIVVWHKLVGAKWECRGRFLSNHRNSSQLN